MSDRKQCRYCRKPMANEHDCEEIAEGEGEHLCWEILQGCDQDAEEAIDLRDARIAELERELAKEKEWHAMSKDAAIRVQRERDKLERELAALRFAAARVEWKYGRNDDGTPKRWKEWDDLREALGEHVRQPQELARMIRHVEENPTVIPNMSQESWNCDTSGEHGTP